MRGGGVLRVQWCVFVRSEVERVLELCVCECVVCVEQCAKRVAAETNAPFPAGSGRGAELAGRRLCSAVYVEVT